MVIFHSYVSLPEGSDDYNASSFPKLLFRFFVVTADVPLGQLHLHHVQVNGLQENHGRTIVAIYALLLWSNDVAVYIYI